jgi:hypothetical protein
MYLNTLPGSLIRVTAWYGLLMYREYEAFDEVFYSNFSRVGEFEIVYVISAKLTSRINLFIMRNNEQFGWIYPKADQFHII